MGRGPGTPRADRLSREQVGELAATHFALRDEHRFLARQYFLVFGVGE